MDMALEEYRRKRKFSQTPEPGPKVEERGKSKPRFVVQMHRATHLHYDFRLEMEGVLKSWAVPKGPTLDPNEKRLAMMVEDHPLSYLYFEGIIPAGNYGAGTVMVWDTGDWEASGAGHASEALAKGDLKFILHGEKLKGEFALVHMKSRRPGSRGNEWLLIKKRDAYAAVGWDSADLAWSVLTHRSLEQIAGDGASGTWESNREDGTSKGAVAAVGPSKLPGAVKAPMPEKVDVMLATPVREPEDDSNWLFEIKWDGIRAVAFLDRGKLRLQSRSHRDISACYPDLAGMARTLNATRAVLDGEIVTLDAEGRSSFGQLQQRMNLVPDARLLRDYPVIYYAFDLLYLDGYDLRRGPLEQRKQMLRAILEGAAGERVRYSDHQEGHGKELAQAAAARRLEGIIGKRRDSLYQGRRSRDWQKIKTAQEAEAIVGGYTDPRGSRPYFGSLVLGVAPGRSAGAEARAHGALDASVRDGKLVHVGNAGSGFSEASQKEVWEKLKALRSDESPFAGRPRTPARPHWVRPELHARVRFAEWTNDHKMRAPVVLEVFDPRRSGRPALPGRDATAPRALFSGSASTQVVTLEGHTLKIQNLDKVFFPEEGYTKRDVIEYYYGVADYLLPHMQDRPLALKRYPDGIAKPFFFQKETRGVVPEWVPTVPIRTEHGRRESVGQPLCNDLATLVYLANLGCIDQNMWLSSVGSLDHPDFVLFDLDPGEEVSFDQLLEVVLVVKAKLEELGLTGYPKTSGGSGMHIWLPLAPGYSYEDSRNFARLVYELALPEVGSLVTFERSLSRRRKDRVLLDYPQNAIGKTVPPPYSLRPREGAPVSAPLLWKEVKAGLDPLEFNIRTIWKRLEKHGDLYRGVIENRQRLGPALERALEMAAPQRRTGTR